MSWWGLLSIYREAGFQVALERSRKPVACPNDGEPLRISPQGDWFCPVDGWKAGSATQADYLDK